jgi:hypothetical protein
MFIYLILLCSLVPIIYLFQFLAYSDYRNEDLNADLSELIGLTNLNVFDFEMKEEEQLSEA